ncbi:class I SAM-dependent methyltransferase family protein [Candidatus Micrarchaeota archaeon CG_4_10_14_0_2_um_filter_55_9]|nr:MAG: hypothetical protein AUJ15_00110 [Candidatus Micrarchaeota archaeon CG1_02_55_41]PIO02819.1 MAG: class I SAM-dependent methyltransferase family protein [Candidatus Micrarchaeota archaeon CG09_land_8_20_14_0_10_55_25]PIZ91716.1 MAG: class I SAM-dependent methyltransferase family protein [Candidatus Micrarchaeota archaeon CG_4_10_14_0_2_um_filter_55_9]PJD01039.1 MAG: class I SAM-dependent methyltransferase family protein [Candidatus Micrarchaeota archaeon CG10_big_fil_rev_8_21_14_0_10_54_1
MRWRDALDLTDAELKHFVSGFDVLGFTAVIEVRPELENKKTLLAGQLMKLHPRLKTVLRKKSAMKGEYRVREFEWLAGEKTTLAEYYENGCCFKFDLARAYFSPRLATERARIRGLVQEGEKILALFAGVGPFPIVIAKAKSIQCLAVELNPYAVEAMNENIALNKVGGRVTAVCADAREVLPEKKGWADRVLMPLPYTGSDFLDDVVSNQKRGCTVHFYGFGPSNDLFSAAKKLITKKCAAHGRTCEFVGERRVRPYAPRISQFVLDFVIG